MFHVKQKSTACFVAVLERLLCWCFCPFFFCELHIPEFSTLSDPVFLVIMLGFCAKICCFALFVCIKNIIFTQCLYSTNRCVYNAYVDNYVENLCFFLRNVFLLDVSWNEYGQLCVAFVFYFSAFDFYSAVFCKRYCASYCFTKLVG